MKKVFIVLLIAAIGAGVYYYFEKQNVHSPKPKELIVHKWKLDSLVVNTTGDSSSKSYERIWDRADSSLKKYEFDFRKDDLIVQTLNGRKPDTSHYEFSDHKNLFIWTNTDPAKTKWSITKLDSAALVVRDQDSSVFYFQRVK